MLRFQPIVVGNSIRDRKDLKIKNATEWPALPPAVAYTILILLMRYHFHAEHWLPVPLEKVFRFFAHPGNLPRLMPAWMQLEILRVHIVPPPGMEPVTAMVTDSVPIAGAGSELVASYRVLPFLPFRIQSIALITEFVMNEHFADTQKRGPFRSWCHRHQFAAVTRNSLSGTLVQDIVEYDIGFGWLGSVAQTLFVGPQMRRTFAFRQRSLQNLLADKSGG